jgi:hypothetical protein
VERPSYHATNDVSHDVSGSVVQAGVVHGGIHLHTARTRRAVSFPRWMRTSRHGPVSWRR